nr:DUF2157 domain-containing protein [Gammaproteobacteria bacterium]
EWSSFIDKFLLWMGVLAATLAVMFFIAFNWDDIGRFAKFALLQALIVAVVLLCVTQRQRRALWQAALAVAAVLVGVLLALFGQTYQTGADPWQLFATWAGLILPWVIVASLGPLWLFWLGLINVALMLYHHASPGSALFFGMHSEFAMWWMLFVVNSVALVIWELASLRWDWLRDRWAPRLVAVAAGGPITFLALTTVVELEANGFWRVVLWLLWAAISFVVYTQWRRDLFMVAGLFLAGSLMALTFVGRVILESFEAVGFLVLALLALGLGVGAANALKKLHQRWSE